MTDPENDKQLDELLDSMLSAYSAAEPRPGLENRILAGMREAAGNPAAPWWSWKWLWAAGAAAAAALLLFMLWIGNHPAAPHPAKTVVQVPRTAQPAPQITQSRPAAPVQTAKHQPKLRVPPRLQDASLPLDRRPAVFPTPTPLSEQERLLLSYYARTPRKELIAQSQPDQRPDIAADESGLTVPDLVLVPQKSSNTR
jgi:hypothetical protein